MEISTNGHTTRPQNANCATIVRLLNTDAVLSGSGSSTGTIKRNAYIATMPHCSLRNSGGMVTEKVGDTGGCPPECSCHGQTFKYFIRHIVGIRMLPGPREPERACRPHQAQQRPDNDPVSHPQQNRDQGRQGAVAGEVRQDLANYQCCRSTATSCPRMGSTMVRQDVQRNQVIQAAHKERAGQKKQQDFGHAEKTAPGDELAAQLQQPETSAAPPRSRPTPARASISMSLPPSPADTVPYRNTTVSLPSRAHGDGHQHQQAPPVVMGDGRPRARSRVHP